MPETETSDIDMPEPVRGASGPWRVAEIAPWAGADSLVTCAAEPLPASTDPGPTALRTAPEPVHAAPEPVHAAPDSVRAASESALAAPVPPRPEAPPVPVPPKPTRPPHPPHRPGELPFLAAVEAEPRPPGRRIGDRLSAAASTLRGAVPTVPLPAFPDLPARPDAAKVAQAIVRGVVSALIVVAIGLAGVALFVVIVAVTGASSGGLDHPDVLVRATGGIWLAAHHVGFEVVEITHTATGSIEPIATVVPVRLAPLGVTVPLVYTLCRLGRRLARGPAVTAITLVTQASVYLGLLSAVAHGVGTATVRPVFATIAVAAAGVLAAAVLGALGPRVLRLPAVRAGLVAGAVLAAGGALLVVSCLLTHTDRLREALAAAADDPAGQVALTLLCAALVPNAIVWAAAYTAGTGFVLGAATTVAPTGTALGTLPALPLLAALPAAGAPSIAWAPTALPLLAGLAAGYFAARALPPRSWFPVTAHAAGAGATAGLLAFAAAWLASGSAGPDNLATLGPSAWRTAAAITVEITVIAASAALGTTWWRGRAQDKPQAAPEPGTACAPAEAAG